MINVVFRKHDQPYMKVCQGRSTYLLFTTGAVTWFTPLITLVRPLLKQENKFIFGWFLVGFSVLNLEFSV